MSRTHAVRSARMAKGHCKYCLGTPHGGTRMCLRHRLYQARWKQAHRQKAKAA